MPLALSTSKNWKIHGSEDPVVLIAGHSHTYAMYCALLNRPKYQKSVAIATQSNFDSVIPLDEEYWNFVSENSEKQPTAISWNGNQHNIHFLINSAIKFKIFGLDDDESTNSSISISRVKSVFDPTFNELRTVIRKFKNPQNLVLLGTPAPKPKYAIEERISTETYYLNLAQELGINPSAIKVSSDKLRVFMWELTQEITQNIAEELNCKFISIPEISIDKNKLLTQEYWANDVTHASEEFAATFIDKILLILGNS